MNGGHVQVWYNCEVASLSYDAEVVYFSCEVKIDNNNILVSYIQEGKPTAIIYKGTEHESGHYELSSKEVKGRATLHRFKGSKFLEGWWQEDGAQGMWRIALVK